MNTTSRDANASLQGHEPDLDEDPVLGPLDIAVVVAENLKLLIIGPLVVGLAALGITYLIPPTFTARTTFLPPQQQQSSAVAALASLGALAGLAGNVGGIKSPADQYMALMQSRTVQDRLIEQYDLMQVYEAEYRFEAREALRKSVRVSIGKKDALIAVEVEDKDPQRAADLANSHVDELRRMTNELAVTEAQQRRAFFEQQLERSKKKLVAAQMALQSSGFTQGALKAEPKAAAESYAQLKAEMTTAEVRLQTMRSYLNENTPEIRQQLSTLGALRAQLTRAEQASDQQGGADYVSKYRDFKYEEALFDLFARQYEMARLDESREGALIQVVDHATRPELKSKPRRAITALGAAVGTLLLLVAFVVVRHFWRAAATDPVTTKKMTRLRTAMGRR